MTKRVSCVPVVVLVAWLMPGTVVGAKPTLKQVIKRVRAAERLYDKIEIRADYTYSNDSPITPEEVKAKKVPVKMAKHRIRVVHVNDRFYYRNARTTTKDKDEEKLDRSTTVATYDGKQTRIVRRYKSGTFVWLYDTRHRAESVLFPNTFLFNGWNLPKPLSRFLSIQDVPGTDYAWAVVGSEKVDGLNCVKLSFEMADPRTGTAWQRTLFWLAVDRNYQAVKVVSWSPSFNARLVSGIGRVTKFVQLKPGVWLPAKTEELNYDPRALKAGKQVVHLRKFFTVKTAKLNPGVKDSLFNSVKIPKGAHVTEYRAGKRVRSYTRK